MKKVRWLYRYMGHHEARDFLNGVPLENRTIHASLRGSATTAVGFTFAPCYWNDEAAAILDARHGLRKLYGIVDCGYLLIARPKTLDRFEPCMGRYPDYKKIDAAGGIDNFPLLAVPQCYQNEYCCTDYSKDTFKEWLLYRVSDYDAKHRCAVLYPAITNIQEYYEQRDRKYC